jgi:hypothetical protein
MRDPSELPHHKLRLACFWVLFLVPAGMRVIDHVWHPVWYEQLDDVAAVMLSAAFLIGKVLYQETQREQSWRLARVERRVCGAESVAPFFSDEGRVIPPVPPRLQAVPGDSGAANRGLGRDVRRPSSPHAPRSW